MSSTVANIALVFCTTLLTSGISQSQTSIDRMAVESLRKMFGDSVTIAPAVVNLTREEQQSIFERGRSRWTSDSIVIYRCFVGLDTVGYGFVDNVKGKTQFITYLVAVQAKGVVQDIDVLAYRESYGGEIAYESFRKQFRQKTAADKLQPGRDIKNISGATISVRAITDGVRKIIATFELVHLRLR